MFETENNSKQECTKSGNMLVETTALHNKTPWAAGKLKYVNICTLHLAKKKWRTLTNCVEERETRM